MTVPGSNTIVGHGPTVGQPKFPEATGHRAGVRVGHPMFVGHWSICALGGQKALKLGPQIGPHRLGAVGHICGPLVGHNCGIRVGQNNLVGQASIMLGQICGDLVGHNCGIRVGHANGALVGHTNGAMVGQV